MSTTIRKRLTQVPFLLVLAVASLFSMVGQTLAYTGVGVLKSIWSGTTGWLDLWSGVAGLFTIDNSGIAPVVATTAVLMPIVFGASLLIMLLMGITLALTRDFRAVLIVAISGIIGILGVIMLQGVITGLLGI
jgi:hypothetical protein